MEITYSHFSPNAQNYENWVAIHDGNVVGHIYMERQTGKAIKFYDAWVHEDYRRKGIYRKLWETRWEYIKKNYVGWKIYAWCLPMSLPLLLEKGFEAGDKCVYVEKTVT
jgi:predicted GNAT family acetyltransferase